jgi:hypothetical protein
VEAAALLITNKASRHPDILHLRSRSGKQKLPMRFVLSQVSKSRPGAPRLWGWSDVGQLASFVFRTSFIRGVGLENEKRPMRFVLSQVSESRPGAPGV